MCARGPITSFISGAPPPAEPKVNGSLSFFNTHAGHSLIVLLSSAPRPHSATTGATGARTRQIRGPRPRARSFIYLRGLAGCGTHTHTHTVSLIDIHGRPQIGHDETMPAHIHTPAAARQ